MFTMTKPFVPLALPFLPDAGKKCASTQRREKPSTRARDREQRLWKLTAPRPVARKWVAVKLVVMVLFCLLVSMAMADCFTELTRLWQSDAIGHVAERAINGRS